ncbi:hypothetical protein CLOL250_00337 [Clostridium sp. L2-50]|nr:hypothetical protein CLOL250_00337 [Clostridium sp. L2-50]
MHTSSTFSNERIVHHQKYNQNNEGQLFDIKIGYVIFHTYAFIVS